MVKMRSVVGGEEGTEERILRAARNVFVRRGTAGARMQEIAEEAGVNQALLHYYFRSKDRLAAAVFREVAGQMIPQMAKLFTSDESLERKVEQAVHLYIDTVRESPFIPSYVVAELHHHPERLRSVVAQAAGDQVPQVATTLLRLGDQIASGVADGTLRPITAEQFLMNLLGLVAAPFLVLPVLQSLIGLDDDDFQRILDVRRAELPGFILNALRP